MRNKLNRLLLLSVMAGIISAMPEPQPAHAYQEIKETLTVSRFLDDNFEGIKMIYRYANEMKKHAMPFNSKKHRDRYRFEPGDGYARKIMSKSRELSSRFKLVNGILCHSNVPNRTLILKESLEALDSITVYSKRAIRANKDNNYALYLASAQGIEKETVALNKLLDELETGINECIEESDARKESL
ncbi:MAG: hypothetical protein II961_08000 [Candidatus Riflebacteria bacterium]|nr:hypothetical protein [Candidatus Riflebacteria bacterium]